MKNGKRPKLPRGLRWKNDSPFIWFSWRDARGKQHQKNTQTTDPAKALGIKLEFLASAQQEIEEIKTQSEDMGKLPLSRVADLYFEWKAASSAAATIERERRIFNSVRKFFGSQLPVKAIRLPLIQQYQQQRRQHVSATMKQAVTKVSSPYTQELRRRISDGIGTTSANPCTFWGASSSAWTRGPGSKRCDSVWGRRWISLPQ